MNLFKTYKSELLISLFSIILGCSIFLPRKIDVEFLQEILLGVCLLISIYIYIHRRKIIQLKKPLTMIFQIFILGFLTLKIILL